MPKENRITSYINSGFLLLFSHSVLFYPTWLWTWNMLTSIVGVQGKREKVRGGLETLLNIMKQNRDLLVLIPVLSRVSGLEVVRYLDETPQASGTIPCDCRMFWGQQAVMCFVFFSPREDPTKLWWQGRVSSPTFVLAALMYFGTTQRGFNVTVIQFWWWTFWFFCSQVACSRTFPEPISWVKSLNGSALPWPLGPSQHLHLHFSHFVSLGWELFTTIGKFFSPGRGIHIAFFSKQAGRNPRHLFLQREVDMIILVNSELLGSLCSWSLAG